KHLPFSKLFNHFFSNFFNQRWNPDFYNRKSQARTLTGSGKKREEKLEKLTTVIREFKLRKHHCHAITGFTIYFR
ncbi:MULTISPECIES: hypothetical protein, partial [Butyricimonas]|uniref:hypothetical protein n=1 Tax=Butyricimonas TaxID=574697 RepID=UPI0025874400